jgi:D-alanine-D-alanine ligase
MSRLSVAVIGGGRTVEHDVSLASAASVAAALDASRYRVVRITIDRDGGWQDASGDATGISDVIEVMRGCDLVIPLVHGRNGEDGTLAALCELIGVPYVGSGAGAGAIGMNKHVTKLVAESLGIRTAPAVLLDSASALDYRFSHPVVVKPNSAGSSVGVSLVTEAMQLPAAMAEALATDTQVLVEDVIVGREIDIAVMRGADGSVVVSPALEIEAVGLFDHDAKYGGDAVFHIPAVLDDDARSIIESAAVRMYEALGCCGVARIDFFLAPEGLVLNEVNTTPGFTAQSQVPRMFEAAGVPYAELLDLLIADALATRSEASPQLSLRR